MSGDLKQGDHLEDLEADKLIMLKFVLNILNRVREYSMTSPLSVTRSRRPIK
jgi:hypothetical protein